MDVDAFVLTHQGDWQRLSDLAAPRRRLRGTEVDEIVDLYQRVSTHLSMVRSSSTDAALVARLSTLVARARSKVTGAHVPLWKEFNRFWTVSFPVVAYRAWRWWLATAAAFVLASWVIAAWVAGNPEVQQVLTPAHGADSIVDSFTDYYSNNPAPSFAFKVWTNNAYITLKCIASAVLLGLPIPYVLFANALNLGALAGLMANAGKTGYMLGMLAPHGLLELSAVFLAGAVGMRLGWRVIAPGDRPRSQVLGEQGRAVVSVALALVVVLLVAGLIEAFVTPSGLPVAARVGVGLLAEAAFLGYVIHFGRRAVRAGESGDIANAPDVVPTG